MRLINLMKHIVHTRLGIGIARPSFFRLHIELLNAGLARSMKQQTSDNFTWVIGVDPNIDADNLALLKTVISGHPNFTIQPHDPIASERFAPTPEDCLPEGYTGPVLHSRVDDDDLITTRFIEEAQAEILGHDGPWPIAFSYERGLELHPPRFYFGARNHPAIGLGLTVASKRPPYGNTYRNHLNVHADAIAAGGSSILKKTDMPQWVYHRRLASDSAKGRLTMRVEQNYARGRNAEDDRLLNETLRLCGVPEDYPDTANRIIEDYPDPAPPVLVNPHVKRMSIKTYLRNRIMEVGDTDPKEREALIAAFYMV